MKHVMRLGGLLLLLAALGQPGYAQFRRVKTPLTVAGYGHFTAGDTLRLGQGSQPDGSYRFIHQRQTLFNLEPLALSGKQQGRLVAIRAVHYSQHWRNQRPYLLLRIDRQAYRADLLAALQAGELTRASP